MKVISNVVFSKFRMQFGEDVNSDINQILSSLVVTPNLNHIEFKVGIIDKKLEPFTILNKLIRVKRINTYLHVLDNEDNIVGTFKYENCNFKNIVNYESFLKSFAISNKSKMYDSNYVNVPIDVDNILFDEIVLYNKESKKLEELNNLKGDSRIIKKLEKRAYEVEERKTANYGTEIDSIASFIGSESRGIDISRYEEDEGKEVRKYIGEDTMVEGDVGAIVSMPSGYFTEQTIEKG